MTSIRTKSPFLTYLGIGIALIFGAVLVFQQAIRQQSADLVADNRARLAADFGLLQTLVRGTLQRRDYQQVEGLLGDWARARPDIVELRLITANGFVLGAYRKDHEVGDTPTLRQPIDYGPRGNATLELTQDPASLQQRIERRRVETGLVTALVAAALLALLWSLALRGHTAARLRAQREQMETGQRLLADCRQVQAELRDLLQEVLDSEPSVVAVVDREGAVLEWNRAAVNSTHIDREDALGLQLVELMPQLAKYGRQIRGALEQGRDQRLQRLTQVSSGTVRYADLLIHPLARCGAGTAVIRLADATQRVRFEQMMVQNEKMLSLGGLAAGVAHEINSPLSGVLQNCQNISRRLSADLATNRQVAEAAGLDLQRLQDYLERRKIPQFLDMVREAAERAGHIVTDMLAFSRHAGDGQEKVSLNEMLDTAVRLACSDYDMRRRLGFSRIEIERDFAADLPLLHCDQTRIQQVFLNLMKNAAQAMAATETPPPRQIRLRTRGDGDHLRVEVEDNGPGMSNPVRQQVFEPFFTTRQGNGLGLSVAHFIVTELHKGSIEVDPNHHDGTRFVIRLPINGNAAAEPSGLTREH